jgi:uncharacterized protein YvpB
MQLHVLQDTVFKQFTLDSGQLRPKDQIKIQAGQQFFLHSWKPAGRYHMKVALLGKNLGQPPRNTWYVFLPHVKLVSQQGIASTQLHVLRNTVFKQATVNSSQLQLKDKIEVQAGQEFSLHFWKPVGRHHMRVALLDQSLGEPPRNTWYVFLPDVKLVSPPPIATDAPPRPQFRPRLPATKRLNVPYKSQLDNALNPNGACNVTCFAMVMAYFQIQGRTAVNQLEDELYRYMLRRNLSRHEPGDLVKLAQDYGLRNDFTMRGELYDIRKAIAEGRPCIVHGYFTSFGHIIVIRGYDQYGFYVNDPFGEWTSQGYIQGGTRGANLHYSNGLIQSKCSPEGKNHIWLHRLAKA